MHIYDKIRYLEEEADSINKYGVGDAPIAPKRHDFDSHATYGAALDEYEDKISKRRTNKIEAGRKAQIVFNEIEQLIKDETGLSKLPETLCDKFWRLAWEDGHSNGYEEVYRCASEFEDIVFDILRFKEGKLV